MRLPGVVWFVAVLCSPAASLRVLCWNIHHGAGTDGRIDIERIAAVIRGTKPDVVAFQEVGHGRTRSGRVAQAAEPARLTGMAGHLGKAMDFQGGACIGGHRIRPPAGLVGNQAAGHASFPEEMIVIRRSERLD